MDIKYIFTFSILFIMVECQSPKKEIAKFSYCTKEQIYCASSLLDTAKYEGNFFQHFPSYTSIKEFDTTNKIAYEITWGNCETDIDWGPFTNYTYDTLVVKHRLNLGYYKTPIYFMKVQNYNNRKFITICNELRGMGIIIHSHYYSDSLNILIQTTYVNQFDYLKININRHYEILENTEIFNR